ncbi:hypothetical protein GCM10009095_00470 [Sphingomonas molluscorum]|nr:hypothetical protein GCM10017606_10910 [Microbacterium terregens]
MAAKRVGEGFLKAVADCDPHLVFVGSNEEDDAVVVFCPPDPPGVGQSGREGGNVPPIQRRDGHDDHLMTRRLFKRVQALGKRFSSRGIYDAGGIGDVPCQDDRRL